MEHNDVATISDNFFLLKSLFAGTTTVMRRYGLMTRIRVYLTWSEQPTRTF